jgi:peptidoglycan/LPS O-acetylase OafA/YrhL
MGSRRLPSLMMSRAAPSPFETPASQSATPAAVPAVTWLSDMLTPERNSFGVMRLMLALAVLVSHSVYLTTGRGELEPLYTWTGYTLGQHGVQGFFLLSGILVAQSLHRAHSLRDFALARALRIFPALIVCVLLTALILGPWMSALPPAMYLKDQGVAAYIAKTISLWSGSAMLPAVFQDNVVPRVVNSSVWTLKYEVLCYAILGLAGWMVLKAPQRSLWLGAAFAVWLATVLYKPVGLELHSGAKGTVDVLRYFILFFGTGVAFYVARAWVPVTVFGLLPLGLLAAVSIGGRFDEPALALLLGYLMLWLGTFSFGGLRAATNESDYSYATYLYHMPVSQTLLALLPGIGVVSLIGMTLGVTLLLAFVSWELIERPALRLRQRLATVPRAAPTRAAHQAAGAGELHSAVLPQPQPWKPMTTVRKLDIAMAAAAPAAERLDGQATEVAAIPASRLASAATARAVGRLQRSGLVTPPQPASSETEQPPIATETRRYPVLVDPVRA